MNDFTNPSLFIAQKLKLKNKTSSNLFITICLTWLLLGFNYLFYAYLVLNLKMSGIAKLILSPIYWITSFVAIIAGYGLLRVRWYGWYVFIFSNILLAYQTALTLVNYSESTNKLIIFTLSLLTQSALIVIVKLEVRVPYFFPKIRWWESDPRQKLSIPVQISKNGTPEFEAEILDISSSGCFIKSHQFFILDDLINLKFHFFDTEVTCAGDVVWKFDAAVTHPKGIGVKFKTPPKETVLKLKSCTKKLKELSNQYAQNIREKNWQDFLEREKRYQGKK